MQTWQTSATDLLLVDGPAGAGKTAALVRHVHGLLEGGAAADDVLVLAASPMAAAALQERIARPGVAVTCARQAALSILADPRAQRTTGRGPELLGRAQERAFFDAVKATGVKPRRLKEMLRFFFRSFTELADWNADWLVSQEEESVHATAREALAASGGVLECEAASLALRALRADAGLQAEHERLYVVVDDLPCCSRASQALALQLAARGFAAAGSGLEAVEVWDSYPARDGIEALSAAFPQARRVMLRAPEDEPEVAQALRAVIDAGHAVLEERTADLPLPLHVLPDEPAELTYVAQRVREELDAGTPAGGVFVAAPTWARAAQLARALQAAGVAVAPVHGDATLAGGFRTAPLPSLGCRPGAVTVGLPQQARGLAPQLVLLTGFANGWFPSASYFDLDTSTPDHQQRVFDAEARVLYSLLGRSGARFEVTSFEFADPAWAQKSGLDVERVRMRDGRPQARIARSAWLAAE